MKAIVKAISITSRLLILKWIYFSKKDLLISFLYFFFHDVIKFHICFDKKLSLNATKCTLINDDIIHCACKLKYFHFILLKRQCEIIKFHQPTPHNDTGLKGGRSQDWLAAINSKRLHTCTCFHIAVFFLNLWEEINNTSPCPPTIANSPCQNGWYLALC